MAAGVRRRLLPAWMGAAGEQRAAAAPQLHRAGRRRGRLARAARPRAAPAIYCMNEAELVDEALAVLTEARSGSEGEQELQLTPVEAPGRTDGTEGRSDRSPALPCPTDAGTDTERPGWEDSEDDALKYVREIFFS